MLIAACSAGSLLVAASPASADPGCTHLPTGGTWCSSSVNDSGISATALFNWCTTGATGAAVYTMPTCSSGGVPQKSYGLAPNGGHTPYSEDWDTLQIDAGWCYKVKFVVAADLDQTRTYDRRGKSAAWVKVADNADAHIQGQSRSTCP